MKCIIGAGKESSKLLEEFVNKSSSLNLISTFTDSGSIRNHLSSQKDIDLVFFDMDISEMDLPDFINSLQNKPNLILISSGDQNALEVCDINIVDYIIKPITYSRFCMAVDKALRYYSRRESSNSGDNEIHIKRGSRLVKVKLKDIIFIEALENYVTLNTRDEKFPVHFTMKAIEDHLLQSGIFIRVHELFIVNKSMIHATGENSLELINGDELKSIPLGSTFRDKLV